MDITLVQKMEVCKFNQVGFCKFGGKCFNKHENEICKSRNECIDSNCNKRHPRNCRYFLQFNAYSHMVEKNIKVEELEKEMMELKDEVNKLKRILVMMNKKINELNIVPDVKSDESKDTNEKKKKANSEENEEHGLKCDKCDYRAKRKITLKKHMNTKHNITDKTEETMKQKKIEKEAENKDKDVKEKDCIECVTCEKCDYMKNSDKCVKCNTIYEDAIEEYVAKGKDSALHRKLHT